MARDLNVLSAGAAKAVVLAMKPVFEASHAAALNTTFGASASALASVPLHVVVPRRNHAGTPAGRGTVLAGGS